jgi:hypothetical protein
VAIGLGGLGSMGAAVFFLRRYGKKHPESKLGHYLGFKAVFTKEFDEEETASDAELTSKPKTLLQKYPFLAKIADWYSWEQQRITFAFIMFICVFGVATYGYAANSKGSPLPFLPWAKAFGKSLDFMMGFVLLPVLRNFLSYLRNTPASVVGCSS